MKKYLVIFSFFVLASSVLYLADGNNYLMGARSGPCLQIYYDQSEDSNYWIGQAYATFLQNLLGHFPEYQQIVAPIESYQKGEIENCQATFYIGSYFNNKIPSPFFSDFKNTQKAVVWLGYNVWNFSGDTMSEMWDHEYSEITKLNLKVRDDQGRPTFFKDFNYNGEVFSKYGKFKKGSTTDFVAPFELISLKAKPSSRAIHSESVQVIATSTHNGTKEVLPYILHKKNKYYIADVPFSFIHEADRYLIFTDLLFDILKEKPRWEKHHALLRLEDIHPMLPISYLYSAVNALISEDVPIHISLIPLFFDPLNNYTRRPDQEFMTLNQVPEFSQFLREMKKKNAVMIWHGSTHQNDQIKNPHSGVSGDDFEFWDAVYNRPLKQDSSEFVLDRLDAGFYELLKADIVPNFWLTPHYQASPLDYLIFARVFSWNVGRVIYFNHTAEVAKGQLAQGPLIYSRENSSRSATKNRYDFFRNMKVSVTNSEWYGQFFPYEIYGDVYGQKVIPENLGNSQPTANQQVVQPRSIDEIISDARRNLVIRDSWASVFYHVQLLNIDESGGTGRYPGDPDELKKLVRALKNLGYEFINLDEFHLNNKTELRPPPIYKAYLKNGEEQK